jgi:hypothetical protein
MHIQTQHKEFERDSKNKYFKTCMYPNSPTTPNLLWCKHNFRTILNSLSHDKLMMHVLDAVHSTNPCNHDFVFLSFCPDEVRRVLSLQFISSSIVNSLQSSLLQVIHHYPQFGACSRFTHCFFSLYYYYEVVYFFRLWCCCCFFFFFFFFFPQNVSLHLCLIWWNHIIIKLFHESWNQCSEKMSSLRWWSCWLIASMLQQL